MPPIPRLTKPKFVELDWKAYYKEFAEVHGNNPVMIGNRLTFEDGWQYSSTDYGGPEWAPPDSDEELGKLLMQYWEERKKVVIAQLFPMKDQWNNIQRAARARPLPLFVKVKKSASLPDGSPTIMRSSEPLDETTSQTVIARIQWLEDDAAECDRHLENLRNGIVERASPLERPSQYEEPVDLPAGLDGSYPAEYDEDGPERRDDGFDEEDE